MAHVDGPVVAMWRRCLLGLLVGLGSCGEAGGAAAVDARPGGPDGMAPDGSTGAPDGIAADSGAPSCGAEPPLRGDPAAPVLVGVRLECQEGRYLNLMATVTDPQGDADLQEVPQVFDVFDGPDCTRARWVVTDDLAGSGQEESFGVIFERDMAPTVFDTICASERWPVRARLKDASGNRTEGLVSAVVTP